MYICITLLNNKAPKLVIEYLATWKLGTQIRSSAIIRLNHSKIEIIRVLLIEQAAFSGQA